MIIKHSLMHYATIILDPTWRGKSQNKDKEITIGFRMDKFIFLNNCKEI
jgi:hypothetical protein